MVHGSVHYKLEVKMSKLSTAQAHTSTEALLQVADFLARPQRFVAVAEARAELRETLEQAQTGSIILTNNGVPSAAIVPFTTLEEMRQAVMRLLVDEMEQSFQRAQARVQGLLVGSPTSEEELETLTSTAVRRSRRSAKQQASRQKARR